MSHFTRKYGLYFGWVFASLGILGSLYFSEVRNMEPCHLCWYQRIALFPVSLILGIATYLGDRKVIHYALPMILIGLFFALYQISIQEFQGWNPIEMCGAGPSCKEKTLIGLGPLTLPMLSALNFLFIAFLLILTWYYETKTVLQERLR
jgi:disulfide bond formation protein DsbB